MPKKQILAVAVAMAFGAPAYEARAQSIAPSTLPTGGRIVAGQASITTSGASMAIQQTTTKAALDWQSFSIGSQAAVRFNQPSVNSIALNRVLGNDGSQILGQLSANGQVFLINPNGILFGRGAQVDVGGILGSTLHISADDFMSGRYILKNPGNSGAIVNQGSIKGGYAAFLAPSITNDGLIEAQHGTVALTAANAATVDLLADGLVQIKVNEGALAAQIANNGVIRADGGVVTLTATAKDNLARSVVNNTGIIEARTVENVNGVVRLGGIKLLADEVNVTGNARIDASGDAGGGEILIGGNYQGRGPEANALTTTVGSDAVISADAYKAGDGGRVIVWSNEKTSAHGSITARGGASGKGGFVETSGHDLDLAGVRVATSRGGQWLIDPTDVTIYHAGGSGTISDTSINSSLDSGTDVTITTSGTGGNGDITIYGTADTANGGAVSIVNTIGGTRTLTLLADRDINMHGGASIAGTTANSLATTLNSNRSDTGGSININGVINTFGGDVKLIGGSLGTGYATSWASGTAGIAFVGATVNSGTGAMTIRGQGFTSGANVGVVVASSDVSSNGPMNVSTIGDVKVVANGARSQLKTAGAQAIDATGTVRVWGAGSGSGRFGLISADGGQTINADSIELLGGADGGGVGSGNFAQIANQGAAQTVTVGAGGMHLAGGGGALTENFAGLFSAGTQSITVNGGGAVLIEGGSSSGVNVGSTSGSRAFIGTGTSSTSQVINFTSGGSLTLIGGTVGSRNFASINAQAGNQTITGSPTIMVTAGASGGLSTGSGATEENSATIVAQAAGAVQNITSGNISVTGGNDAGGLNFAGINATTQNITVHGNLLIEGKNGGPARIGGVPPIAAGTNLTLHVDNNATLTGGTVSTAGARIGSNGAGGLPVNIDMTVAGNLTLNGGAGQAWIGNPGSNAAGGGTIDLTAANIALNGQANAATIRTTGAVSVTTTGDLSLTAGSGTGAVALITGQGIDVHAGSLHMTAGGGASDNNAAISTGNGQTVSINVTGDTVLQGGSSFQSSAFIGLGGNGDSQSAIVNFTGGGDLALNAGSATSAAAAIGAGGFTTNANVPVSITAANVSLNDSTQTLARLGHSNLASNSNGPGDVTVTASGAIDLNGTTFGSAIRTAGSVTLSASSISQSSSSAIVAGSVVTNSTGTTTLFGTITADSLNGPASVTVAGGGVVGNGAVVTATGGSAGNVGVHPANVNINAGAAGISWSGGSITAKGGSDAAPASKDDANIRFQSAGNLSISNATLTTSGFNPDIEISAIGDIGVTSSTLTSTATREAAGVFLASDAGNVLVTGSTLSAAGVEPGTPANQANTTGVGLLARHDVTVTGTSMNANGGTGVGDVLLFAGSQIISDTPTFVGGGNLHINAGSNVTTVSGGLLPSNGAQGGIKLTGDDITIAAPIAASGVNNTIATVDAANVLTLTGPIGVNSSTGSAALDVSAQSVVASGAVINVNAGSSGGAGSHNAEVNLTAGTGGISWTGGSITADGGSDAQPQNKGHVEIVLTSGGNLSLSGASVTAGGSFPDINLHAVGDASISDSTITGTGSRDTPWITVDAGGSILITGSTLALTAGGPSGPDYPDESLIRLVAQQDITLSSATLTADGGQGVAGIIALAGGVVQDGDVLDHVGGGNLTISAGTTLAAVSGSATPTNGATGGISLAGDTITMAAGTSLSASGVNYTSVEMEAFSNIDIFGPITANATAALAEVKADAAGDITIGSNISTNGIVVNGGGSGPGQGGIFLTAGNAIIGAGGILDAVSTTPGIDGYVSLHAVNGIGTVANPIRFANADLWAANTGTTVGDLAMSLVSGNLDFNPAFGDDLVGYFTNATNGTYLFQLENGNVNWNGLFSPNNAMLLAGQSVQFKTLNGSINMAPGSNIQTFGAGNITLTANNTTASGAGVFLSGPLADLSQPKSHLQASGTGNITIEGTSTSGAGVFVGGEINAVGGHVSITGTGATVGGSGTNTVAGVTNPSLPTDDASESGPRVPRVHAGKTVTIIGVGGTTTGSGSAAGVGFGGNNAGGNFGRISIDGEQGVSINGTGGTSATGGAAGVAITSGSANWGSHVGSDAGAGVTITGHAGTAGGAAGGNGIGVLIGGGNDLVETDVSSFGQISINGFGGTAHNLFGISNNVGANGIAFNHAIVQSTSGISIFGQGGAVTVDNATLSGSGTGVGILDSTIRTAQAGNISIEGIGSTGGGAAGNANGVGISDGSVIQTQGFDIPQLGGPVVGTGSIMIEGIGGGHVVGTGASGTGGASGVAISHFNTTSGGSILSNTGAITLIGQGGNAVSGESRGIVLRANGGTASKIESTGGGAISLTGAGGNAASTGSASTTGVAIGSAAGSPSLVRTAGDIAIEGTGGNNTGTTSSSGVGVSDGAAVQALGSGSLSITGEGGTAGAGGAHGIVIAPFNTTSGAFVSTNAGALALTGLVGSATGPSLALRLNDSVVSTASGAMTVNATGDVAVVASNTAGSNTSTVLASGGTQSISVTAGALTVQGANTGSGATARIASTGNQTINADSITLHAGDAGGVDLSGNAAQIVSNNGTQTITTTGDMTLTAGAAGFNNGVVVAASTQNITVHGDLSLTGGGSDPTTIGSGARIGGLGGTSPSPTNLTLHVDGDVNLVGGTAAGATGAAIGTSSATGSAAQPTNMNLTIGGNLSLTRGSASGARIGSSGTNASGGDIAITTGGDILVGSGLVQTAGNIVMSAGGAISSGADGQIVTPDLKLVSTNGITGLHTQTNALTVTNTNNDVDIHNIGVLSLNGVTNTNGGFALDNIGNITVTAPVHVGTFLNLTAHSDIIIQSDIFANTTGTMSGTSIDLSAATDGTSDVTQASGTTLDAGGSSVNVGAGGTVGMSGSLSGSSLTATTTGGAVVLPTSTLTGGLDVSTSGGNISESGSLVVGGTANLQAGSGTITLASASNDFVGAVSATGLGGVSLADANTLTPGTVDAGTSSATLTASTLGAGGPVIASTATLSSNTPVTGLTTSVTNQIVVGGAATSWNLSNTVAGTPITTTTPGTRVTANDACAAGCATTVTELTGGTVNPAAIVTSTVTTSSQTSTTTTTTSVSSPTLSFSASLAPSAVSSPVQIVAAPTSATTAASTSVTPTSAPSSSATSAPADTSSSTSTASASPSSTTSSSTASADTSSTTSGETTQTASASPSSSSSSSTSAETSSQGEAHAEEQSTSQGGGKQQTASSSRATGSGGRATLTAAAARLVASMQQLHDQKVQATEKAVAILERNPAAADLKPCNGAVSGDCIAPRPAEPRSVANLPQPTLANLPKIERKVALLIGVNDYRGAIPKLNSPLRDIREIGKIYKDQFGYEVRTLANADKATIVRALNRLIQESGPNDSVTVFYAGHGQLVEKTGRGYWIPARASADDPSQWISNQDIGKALENIPAKQVLLVSDSCYSGTLTRDAKVQRDEVLQDPAQVLERRSVTVLSSGGEEPVADAGRQGHSVFAYHYMQALKSVEKWSNGIDVHDRLAASVAKEFPQLPQYGEALRAGHERGGDFLFEVRRY